MAKDDFVNVRLTEFGKERAAGARIQVHAGNHSFYFEPDEVQLVTRAFDWNRVLKNEHFNGHPLFEIVPEETQPGAVTPENVNDPIKVIMGTENMEVSA
jgi:hypothetical protein